MRRELVLLRHADAEADSASGRDFDRPLSDRGRHQAKLQGEALASLAPLVAYVSPAERTRETFSELRLDPSPELHHKEQIYEATAGDLLVLLAESQDIRRLLVVGHNPGLSDLLTILVGGYQEPLKKGEWVWLTAQARFQPGSATLIQRG